MYLTGSSSICLVGLLLVIITSKFEHFKWLFSMKAKLKIPLILNQIVNTDSAILGDMGVHIASKYIYIYTELEQGILHRPLPSLPSQLLDSKPRCIPLASSNDMQSCLATARRLNLPCFIHPHGFSSWHFRLGFGWHMRFEKKSCSILNKHLAFALWKLTSLSPRFTAPWK